MQPEPESAPRISDSLVRIFARVTARAESFVAGPHWVLEVVLLSLLYSALFSSGIDKRLYEINNNYSGGYFDKIAHPLLDLGTRYPAWKHDAKLNFRLTVPVVLHVLHVPPEEHWVLPVLSACATCGIIAISCIFACQIAGDRVCGLFTALAVASTYIGSLGFTRYYDAIAICQLALAMLPRTHWSIRGLLVFTASFTDERALLACLLLLVQSLCLPPPGSRSRWLAPNFLAVTAGMLLYGLGRLLLVKFAGLSSPTGGVGLSQLAANAPFWHAGVWYALNGGWLLVGLAMIALWQRRQFLALGAFGASILAVLAGGFLVEDVLRSTSYVFPALLVALALVSANEKLVLTRAYCFMAFVVSLAAGSYNVWLNQVSWFKPMAAQFVEYLLNLILRHQSG